jgi:hypothetical protein
MLMQRYFRASAETYESMRLGLNSAWGMPNAGTQSCYTAADNPAVPRDEAGRLYLAVHSEWCDPRPTILRRRTPGEITLAWVGGLGRLTA